MSAETAGLEYQEVLLIDELVSHFEAERPTFEGFVKQLLVVTEVPVLARLLHSVRSRVKDPSHLRDKLMRKMVRAKQQDGEFDINKENLFERINDLAGVRLLHLHTTQFEEINATLVKQLDEYRYRIVEGPAARIWDDEYRDYFAGLGIEVVASGRMYTSVHYVVEPNRRTKITAEIQVRTLAEELWGEVDHSLNYPRPSDVLACQEQIKVLARVTSSCTRLVDAIFKTHTAAIKDRERMR